MPDSVFDSVFLLLKERENAATSMVLTSAINIISAFSDYSAARIYLEKAVSFSTKIYNFCDFYYELGKLYKQVCEIDDKNKKLKREQYWKNHEDEKHRLDNKLCIANSNLSDIKAKENVLLEKISKTKESGEAPVLAEKEVFEIESEIKSKQQEFEQLGLFSGKKKRAIKEDIDKLNAKKNQKNKDSISQREKMTQQINDTLQKLEKEYEPIKAEIDKYEKIVKEIEDELNKDR